MGLATKWQIGEIAATFFGRFLNSGLYKIFQLT